jgi:hypothetical protein
MTSHDEEPPAPAPPRWTYRTVDVVRWHFDVTDTILIVGCALAALLVSLADLMRARG